MAVALPADGDLIWGQKIRDAVISKLDTTDLSSSVAALVSNAGAVRSALDTRYGSAGTVTDSQVNTILGTNGGASRNTVLALATRLLGDEYNAIAYGADPTGAVDSTAAINAASTAAVANGGLIKIPPGDYLVSGPIYIYTSIDARGAAIHTSSPNGVYVGPQNPGGSGSAGGGSVLFGWRGPFFLPAVYNTGSKGGTFGLTLTNMNTCEIHVPWVDSFEHGIYVLSQYQGFAYNTIHLGGLWQNSRQIDIQPNSGWANQNTVIGGRVQSILRDSSHPENGFDTDVFIAQTSNLCNNWTFIGTSFEGNITGQYRMMIEGQFHKWINCRWEDGGSGINRIRWGATAVRNHIEGGHNSQTLQSYDISGSLQNVIELPWLLSSSDSTYRAHVQT